MGYGEFNFTCSVCGKYFESDKGESFIAFSNRIYDDHVAAHIASGVTLRTKRNVKRGIDLDVQLKEGSDG